MSKIISAKNIGKHQTYDIEVNHKDHQFYLENGLLTSNSHSDAYTVLTMQTAWLATYYPLEFYSALLTLGTSGELQDYVSDIKRCGVKILPVDINESKGFHKIEGDDSIRLSFSSVLGLGPAAIEKIVAGQPYSDFNDFLERSKASKSSIEPLIKVGAFDNIEKEKSLKEIHLKYEIYVSNPKFKTKKMHDEWMKYWNEDFDDDDYALHEKVAFENELLQFSVRGSPFEILSRNTKLDACSDIFIEYEDFLEKDFEEAEYAAIPVVIKDFKERPQRNGQMFAFIKFGTRSGREFEAPAFSNLWKHLKPKVKKGSVYIATFNRREDDVESLVVGKPGFAHSAHSAQNYLIDVDEIDLEST